MAWTSRFTDDFAEASADTNLPSHTPTTGTQWSALSVPSGTHAQAGFTDDTLIQPYYAGATNNYYTADWGGTYNANMQRAELSNTSTPGNVGGRAPCVNLQAGVDGYAAAWDTGTSRFISYRIDNGSFTSLETPAGGAQSDLCGVSNENGTIWIWRNGAHHGVGVADAAYTGGRAGLVTRKTVASGGGDNFEAFDEAEAATENQGMIQGPSFSRRVLPVPSGQS